MIINHPARIYKLDELYFSKIDCAEKAYWLGFIATDGNINKASNTISISLKRSDKNHLNKLVKCVNSNYVVKNTINSGGNKQAILTMTSAKMKHDLALYGVVPNKAKILKPPKIKKFEKDFWRGCVDGDGSIFKRMRNGRECWGISLVGTYEMTYGFYKYIHNKCGTKMRKPLKDGLTGSSFVASYQGSLTPISVIEFLYNGAKIYLDRKMKLASEAMESERRGR